MKTPFSPSTIVPPPLPAGLNYPRPLFSKKHKIILSDAQASPYRKAAGVIGLFSLIASLLTFNVGWGLNLPILALAALGVAFWRKPHMIRFTAIRVQLGFWFALAVAVVLHFDPWTIIPFLLVTLVLIGGLLFGSSVDPMRGLARALVQLVAIPWAYLHACKYSLASFGRKNGVVKSIIRLTAFPVFIALGFGTLYVWSNRTLSQWSFNFFDQLLVGESFANSLQFGWSLFLSSLVGAGLVYGMKKQDGRLLKAIGVSPSELAESASTWSSVSIALVLVNVLALVLNLVDGMTTWVGEVSSSAAVLTQGVHSGTYTLIAAIVLAASYLLFNFRKAPKDYQRARLLATAWLGQNLMMCFTVALRNYHYTDAYGLTFKRIGVWLFLCCTATGLYFLGRQVRENGSIERLVRRQAWAVYLVLATAAIPNWPGIITHYNFQESRMVLDEDYLKRLLPHNAAIWAEYNNDVLRRTGYDNFVISDTSVRPPRDFRDWDLNQAKRAAMYSTLIDSDRKLKEAIEANRVTPTPNEEITPELHLDFIEVEPSSSEELEEPYNN